MTARLKFTINYQLKSDLRDEFVSSIYIDHFGEDEDFIKNWYMTESDLRVMNSHGNSIGSHAYSHNPLAMLTKDEILEELCATKAFLEQCLGKQVDSISYPLGNKLAVDDRVISIAREAGYKVGLTMRRGINYDLNNLLQLKRIDSNDLSEFLN